MKIAIVGAGITGLTTAYYLSKKGHKVVIYEKDEVVGGLASGFKIGDWYLERFYHHIFKSDKAIIRLSQDLGLGDIWLWKDCGAPVFYNNKIYPFTTAIDLLKFTPLSLNNRLRTGLVSFYLQYQTNYQKFSHLRAADWLAHYMGKESYNIIWQPLLKKKFGNDYQHISMSWIWARIHKRSRFLGYPKGGFQVIINQLVKEILKREGKIILHKEIINICQLKSFDKIIVTVASPIFTKIAPQLPSAYKLRLNKIKYLGTVVTLLLLKKPLSDRVYWLNINDLNIPFVGVVMQSNLVNKKNYHNLYPVYLVSYLPQNTLIYQQKPALIISKWVGYLKKINKNFNFNWIKKWWVFKEPYTQPIVNLDYYKNIPDLKTPLKNIFLLNMTQIYPWDRGVNYAVNQAKEFVSQYF